MGFLFDRLYPASFDGAEFLFLADSRSDGRRVVIHQYPGQGDDTEDLGKNTRQFTIQAVIQGFFYEDNKKKLEKALNKQGRGVLIHPFLGSINCVCLGFTIVEQMESLGKATYTINFKEVLDKTYPLPGKDVRSLIANLYNKLYDFMKKHLNLEYIAKFLKNVEAAAQKLRELERFLQEAGGALSGGAVGGDTSGKSDYENFARKFRSNTTKIASAGGDIGGNVTTLMSNFDLISINDNQARFNSNDSFFGFGSNDVHLNFDTVQNNQNVNNKKVINGSVNSLALTNMYDAARSIEYTDQDQLNNIVAKLNSNYDALIDNDKVILTEDLLDQLDEIRVQANKFFNQIRLTLPRIIEIETNPIPLAVLVYQYYGNTDNYDIILDLNNIYNPSRVSGKIKMLSE